MREAISNQGKCSHCRHSPHFPSKLDDILADTVVACLADKRSIHTRTPQRNDGIKRRAARHCFYRLAILEDNVQNGLSYSYNLAHCIFLYLVKNYILVQPETILA